MLIRPEAAADRPGILALTGAAFAGASGPGEGTVEVGLYEQLFDRDEYIPELSVVADDGLGIEPPESGWGDQFQALLLPVPDVDADMRDAGADHSRSLSMPPVSGRFRYAAPFSSL